MSGSVWMSSVFSNHSVGERLGTRTKHFGRDWDPASGKVPVATKDELEALRSYTRGFCLPRASFPEADAVFNARSFKRVRELFASAGFFVVRGRLAEVLFRFDLGDGNLIDFPVYRADLETPYPDKFFLLNFGARKDTILADRCEDAQKFYVDKETGQQVWEINYLNATGQVVLSAPAAQGADLWFEETVHNKIFMTGALAQALIGIGMADVFRLQECRVLEIVR